MMEDEVAACYIYIWTDVNDLFQIHILRQSPQNNNNMTAMLLILAECNI